MFLTASNARYKHAHIRHVTPVVEHIFAFPRNNYHFQNMEIGIFTWIYISLYDRKASSVKMCVYIDKFSTVRHMIKVTRPENGGKCASTKAYISITFSSFSYL